MADTVLFLNIVILQCSLEVDEEKIIYMHMKIHEKMKKWERRNTDYDCGGMAQQIEGEIK